MANKRVHEIAKEQGISSKDLLAVLQAAGMTAKAAASSVDESVALEALRRGAGDRPPPTAPRRQRRPGRGARRGRRARARAAGEQAPPATQPSRASPPAQQPPAAPAPAAEDQPPARPTQGGGRRAQAAPHAQLAPGRARPRHRPAAGAA